MATRDPSRNLKTRNQETPPPPPVFLPTFSQPPAPMEISLPNNQPESPELSQLESTVNDGDLRPPPAGHTQTSISGRPELDRADLAKAVGGLMKIVITIAEAIIVRTTPRRLRRPTEDQLAGIAAPSASLLKRYANLDTVPESLIDIGQLATAVSDYALADEPLMPYRHVDVRHIGIPDDERDSDATQPPVQPTIEFLS